MLKHQEIAKAIATYIDKNSLSQGDKLPCLSDLVESYQVSKNTMIQSLKNLENSGLIYQVQGSGIFVRKPHRANYLPLSDTIEGFSTNFREEKFSSRLLDFDTIAATQEVATHLNVSLGDKVYYVRRLHFMDNAPFCIEESYFNTSAVTYLNSEIAEKSIFSYLREHLNLSIGFSDKYLHARILPDSLGELLELPTGSPALLAEEIYYLTNGVAFDYSRTYYHYLNAQFLMQATHK